MDAGEEPSVIQANARAEYRAFQKGSVQRNLIFGCLLIAGGAYQWMVRKPTEHGLFLYLFPLLGVLALGSAVNTLFRLRTISSAELKAFEAMADFDEAIRSAKLLYSWILIGGLGLLFLLQHKTGLAESMEIAGLVKDRVREGEWWRLLSCALLHANTIHFATNAASILALGRLIETQGDPEDLPLVFTLSVFTGSIASCALMPSAPSVGASGGILGLAGYLLVLTFQRRDRLPAALRLLLWRGLALTALVGALGFRYVDNAAHLGGLLGGILCGVLLVRAQQRKLSVLGSTLKAMLAWGCLGWFGGAAFFCIRRLFDF